MFATTVQLPGIFASLGPTLDHYGYLAVGGFIFLEDFGVPVPGETILLAAAIYAGAGVLNPVLVGIIAVFAAIIGDNVGFGIGHIAERKVILRYGRFVFITPDRLVRAENFFEHHGGKVIIVARFVEGLRQANGIIAGLTGMRWLRFLMFNSIGAVLWVGCWLTIGVAAGDHIATIYREITRYSLVAAGLAVIGLIAYILVHRTKRKRAHLATSARQDRPADN
ncbi:MAG TPA: DedA family protein [Acidimicrobiales bacterium]|nr:DedA family protein [Acidimicrobiales bacterium]